MFSLLAGLRTDHLRSKVDSRPVPPVRRIELRRQQVLQSRRLKTAGTENLGPASSGRVQGSPEPRLHQDHQIEHEKLPRQHRLQERRDGEDVRRLRERHRDGSNLF